MPSRKSFERVGRSDIAWAFEKWGGLHEIYHFLTLKAQHKHTVHSTSAYIRAPKVAMITKHILKLKRHMDEKMAFILLKFLKEIKAWVPVKVYFSNRNEDFQTFLLPRFTGIHKKIEVIT